MNASLGMDLVRSIFSTIDNAVYKLISVLYNLLIEMSNISIFSGDTINDFSKRIYVLIGIIMLFKVTFSLIEYLINPETITDKTKGTGNLLKNLLITLILIIIVPYGFDLLYSAQAAIIKDNLIPKLILGTNDDYALDSIVGGTSIIVDDMCLNDNGDGTKTAFALNKVKNDGDYIALLTFRPFYQIYEGMENELSYSEKQLFCSSGSVSALLSPDIYEAETGIANLGEYIVDYSFFLSTACGILVMLLLLEFCFDVAMRCIKLGFLEIFAPVAIISYIDPKSSKSGTFMKWLKEVGGTWARLFIRLAILFLAVYIIKIVNESEYSENMWIMLFLVIGALLFAKKAVPLIEDLLGIKFDHSIQLNPFKKIEDQALFGKQIVGLGSGAVGAAGGAVAGFKAGTEVGAVRKGMLVGAISGFSTGFSNKKNPFTTSLNQTYKTLTGNEMARLSVSKMIMGKQSGLEAVGEIKGELKMASEHLRIAESNLNMAQTATADIALSLQKMGLDVKNIEGMKTELKNRNNSLKEEIKSMTDSYNEVTQKLKNYANDSTVDPINIAKLEGQKQLFEKRIKALSDELGKNTDIMTNIIPNFERMKEEEIRYREEITSISKDIETFKKEKAQRERFYQIDSTPQQSVKEAKDHNRKREDARRNNS